MQRHKALGFLRVVCLLYARGRGWAQLAGQRKYISAFTPRLTALVMFRTFFYSNAPLINGKSPSPKVETNTLALISLQRAGTSITGEEMKG